LGIFEASAARFVWRGDLKAQAGCQREFRYRRAFGQGKKRSFSKPMTRLHLDGNPPARHPAFENPGHGLAAFEKKAALQPLREAGRGLDGADAIFLPLRRTE
jgi:hypothetical protein